MKQFEVYYIRLDPAFGSEQKGSRPCLVVQTNANVELLKTILVIPFTSKQVERLFPDEVFVKASEYNGLSLDSKVKCNQIRVVDKSRLVKRIGNLEDCYYSQIFEAISISIDQEGNFR